MEVRIKQAEETLATTTHARATAKDSFDAILMFDDMIEKWRERHANNAAKAEAALAAAEGTELYVLRSTLAQELRRVVQTLHFHDDIRVTYQEQRALGLVKRPLPAPLRL